MKETIAIAIPALSLFIYFVFSSIEFGSSLFSVFPGLMHKKDALKIYMNPIWETTTMFLVFSFISLTAFFPGATIRWGTDLFPITFAFLAVFGIRALCVLLMHYGDVRSAAIRTIYFLSSFAAPSLFALIILYFFTGSWQPYIESPLYALLIAATISGIVAIASGFFRAYPNNSLLTQIFRASGTVFFLATTLFWLSLVQAFPYLFNNADMNAWTGMTMILFIGVVVSGEWLADYGLAFAGIAAFMGASFAGLFAAHLPYLVYPTATIYSSVAGPTSFDLLSLSFIIGAIIVAPALVLLYKLFVFTKK
jgi:cytochrome d ubiquinol oxidase subunit II